MANIELIPINSNDSVWRSSDDPFHLPTNGLSTLETIPKFRNGDKVVIVGDSKKQGYRSIYMTNVATILQCNNVGGLYCVTIHCPGSIKIYLHEDDLMLLEVFEFDSLNLIDTISKSIVQNGGCLTADAIGKDIGIVNIECKEENIAIIKEKLIIIHNLSKLHSKSGSLYAEAIKGYKYESVNYKAAKLKLEQAVEAVFPDMWDWTTPRSDLPDPCMTIHFPEITISNSRGQSQRIYDLYFMLSLRANCTLNPHTIGEVATRSWLHYDASYRHSHLGTSQTIYKGSIFCLGELTPMKISMSELSIKDINTVPDEQLIALMFLIDSYVRWESLEGGPYKRMEEIVNRSSIGTITTSNIKSTYASVLSKIDKLPLAFVKDPILGVKFLLDASIELDNIINECATVKVYQFDDGTYTNANNTTTSSDNLKDKIIGTLFESFKGEKVIVKVTNKVSQGEISRKLVAHPSLLSSVRMMINEKIPSNFYLLETLKEEN